MYTNRFVVFMQDVRKARLYRIGDFADTRAGKGVRIIETIKTVDLKTCVLCRVSIFSMDVRMDYN